MPSLFEILPVARVPELWAEFIAQAHDERIDQDERRKLVSETLAGLASWRKSTHVVEPAANAEQLGSDPYAAAVHAIAYMFALQQRAIETRAAAKRAAIAAGELTDDHPLRAHLTFREIAEAGAFDPHGFDPDLLAARVPMLCDHSWAGLLASLRDSAELAELDEVMRDRGELRDVDELARELDRTGDELGDVRRRTEGEG